MTTPTYVVTVHNERTGKVTDFKSITLTKARQRYGNLLYLHRGFPWLTLETSHEFDPIAPTGFTKVLLWTVRRKLRKEA